MPFPATRKVLLAFLPLLFFSLIGPVEAVLLPTIGSSQALTFKRTDRDGTRLVSDELLRQIADSVRLLR